jgi:hypothetical protein
MSASPTRKIVCVHVLPCAPTARRRSGAGAARVDAIGNHVGHERVEQREQVAAAGRRRAGPTVTVGAERRTFLGRLRRLGAGRSRAAEREHDDPTRDKIGGMPETTSSSAAFIDAIKAGEFERVKAMVSAEPDAHRRAQPHG